MTNMIAMTTKKKILLFFTCALVVSLLAVAVPCVIHAATLHIVADKNVASIGEPIRVEVTLDTQGESVNTVQSEILFPADRFRVTAINDGASIINFWITPPIASTSGEINFAGIISGGYVGSSGSLISFVLTPLASGSGTIEIATATVLRNNGQGSALPVTLASEDIAAGSATYTGSSTAENYSAITPELFTPVVTSDPNLFDGDFFLVFSTVDKGSGIDHYEVLEVPTNPSSHITPSWQVATSPYLLQDQSLSSNVYVRAVNHAGSFLVVELSARHPYGVVATRFVAPPPWYKIAAIIVCAALLTGVFWLIRFLRHRKKSSGV